MPKRYKVELKETVKLSDEVLVEGLMRSIELLEESSKEIRKYLEKQEEKSTKIL